MSFQGPTLLAMREIRRPRPSGDRGQRDQHPGLGIEGTGADLGDRYEKRQREIERSKNQSQWKGSMLHNPLTQKIVSASSYCPRLPEIKTSRTARLPFTGSDLALDIRHIEPSGPDACPRGHPGHKPFPPQIESNFNTKRGHMKRWGYGGWVMVA